jgi:metallophosphoesterase (TIGR00282 family)
LLIGDIVGRSGRNVIKEDLSHIKRELGINFTIANGENAAGGNGITRDIARELFAAGIDVITMGNHVWNKKEVYNFIEQETRLIRPANYPPGAPGAGMNVFVREGAAVCVINMSGRVYMSPLDCPFRKADELLRQLSPDVKIVIVDFHAEASSEKIAMGWYLDGRVSAVCGTHTHVQTADERILPEGTAYITDIGMTGPRDSVIGVDKDVVLEKFLTQQPRRMEVASGPAQLNAVYIDVDTDTGRAKKIERIFNL